MAAGKKGVSAFCLTFGSLVGRLWVSPLSRVMSLKNRIPMRLGVETSAALSAESVVDSMVRHC